MERLGRYEKELSYSYCLGAYPSFRLLEEDPERCLRILISETFAEKEKAVKLCAEHRIPIEYAPKVLQRISRRDNCHMAAVFAKQEELKTRQAKGGTQVILDGIDDMGNLGTIIRCMQAFNVFDLCLIGPTCDPYDPRVIRASMGSFFRLRMSRFESLAAWRKAFPEQLLAALILDERAEVLRTGMTGLKRDGIKQLSMAFGNEGAGLPPIYAEQSDRLFMIPQNPGVDSLNLAEAAGITLYEWDQQLPV